MNSYRRCFATASCVGAALLSTLAFGAPRVVPAAKAPARLLDIPAEVHGRVANGRYQWPGLYFETRFTGSGVYFRTGPGDVILQVSVDGTPVGKLVKPARGLYLVDGLTAGTHTVRVDAVTEAQAGANEFGGFALAPSGKPVKSESRRWQMEFIGDSHTVGYGNTSTTRDCTGDEVWATTDNSQAFGPKVAKHYDADYQVNAISGRGIVRNYNGGGGDPLPVAYPFALLDHSARYDDAGWHPQVIVIALGTNDFSTPLNAGEKWATRDELHADYESTYVKFIEGLRARNPNAFIIVWATDMAEHEIEREAGKVVAALQAKGDKRIDFIPVDSLAMTGCHWHPSLADHDVIANKLVHFIDERHLAAVR